jgi:hypothetical protein
MIEEQSGHCSCSRCRRAYEERLDEVHPRLRMEEYLERMEEDQARYPDEEGDDDGYKIELMVENAMATYQEKRSHASCFGAEEDWQGAYTGARQDDRPEWTEEAHARYLDGCHEGDEEVGND